MQSAAPTLEEFEQHLRRIAIYSCCMQLSEGSQYRKFFEKCVQEKNPESLDTLKAIDYFEKARQCIENMTAVLEYHAKSRAATTVKHVTSSPFPTAKTADEWHFCNLQGIPVYPSLEIGKLHVDTRFATLISCLWAVCNLLRLEDLRAAQFISKCTDEQTLEQIVNAYSAQGDEHKRVARIYYNAYQYVHDCTELTITQVTEFSTAEYTDTNTATHTHQSTSHTNSAVF